MLSSPVPGATRCGEFSKRGLGQFVTAMIMYAAKFEIGERFKKKKHIFINESLRLTNGKQNAQQKRSLCGCVCVISF